MDSEWSQLNDWLKTATEDLCWAATNQIQEEIIEHYRDMLDDLARDGIEGLDAHCEAIDRLGSPAEANKRYRKVFLTEEEEEKLEKMSGTHETSERARVWSRYYMFLLVCFGVHRLVDAGTWGGFFMAFFMAGLLYAVPWTTRFSYGFAVTFQWFFVFGVLATIFGIMFTSWWIPVSIIGAIACWQWFTSIRPMVAKLDGYSPDYGPRGTA